MLRHLFKFCAVATVVVATSKSVSHRYGQPVVIDTDIMSDVDDVGALTVANVLHNCGLADLRGIVINTHSQYGALAANVIPQLPAFVLRVLTHSMRQYAHISTTVPYQSPHYDH